MMPVARAVIFMAVSLRIRSSRHAPTRGRKIVVERIGKLRGFIMRNWSIASFIYLPIIINQTMKKNMNNDMPMYA